MPGNIIRPPATAWYKRRTFTDPTEMHRVGDGLNEIVRLPPGWLPRLMRKLNVVNTYLTFIVIVLLCTGTSFGG